MGFQQFLSYIENRYNVTIYLDTFTARAAINEQENTKTLTKCVKCGTYFIPISFDRLCEDCRNNSQET